MGKKIYALTKYPLNGVLTPAEFMAEMDRQQEIEDEKEQQRLSASPQWVDSPRHRPESAMSASDFRMRALESRGANASFGLNDHHSSHGVRVLI